MKAIYRTSNTTAGLTAKKLWLPLIFGISLIYTGDSAYAAEQVKPGGKTMQSGNTGTSQTKRFRNITRTQSTEDIQRKGESSGQNTQQSSQSRQQSKTMEQGNTSTQQKTNTGSGESGMSKGNTNPGSQQMNQEMAPCMKGQDTPCIEGRTGSGDVSRNPPSPGSESINKDTISPGGDNMMRGTIPGGSTNRQQG